MKLLVVDDSKAMRMIVTRTLRQAGIDGAVTEASNGKEGLAAVRASAPDLILCDWNMPEMSGYEFLVELRKLGINTPFGFVTSECTVATRQQAADAGASFFIVKPFTPEQFKEAIRAAKAS
jgi:two-component system chemotaxis response regulator CheY